MSNWRPWRKKPAAIETLRAPRDHVIQFGYHKECKNKLEISSNGLEARKIDVRRTEGYCYGVVYSAVPLKGAVEFEVEIIQYDPEWGGSLMLGVVRLETGTVITKSLSIPGDCYGAPGHCVWSEDKIIGYSCDKHRYGNVDLQSLRKNDRVGFCISGDGTLRFFVNGQTQGVAVEGVYEEGYDVYAVVDHYGRCAATRITRAVTASTTTIVASQQQQDNILEQSLKDSELKAMEADKRAKEAKNSIQVYIKSLEAANQQVRETVIKSEQQEQQTALLLQQATERAQKAERRAKEVEDEIQQLQTQWVIERDEITFTEEELGRGGWAVVRVAEWRGTRLAAKCFYRAIVSNYNKHLFDREMNIAACLRHPNLVQFIGATLEGEPVILTELMTTSLRAVLEQGPIGQAQIKSISLDVARALNYLHKIKPDPMIHRDISSANVLLDPLPNNHWKAKVSDYGSVNLLQQLQTASPGSPVYAAPEANFPTQQSPKMDIFSFGVLLIEMLTDKFPEARIRDRLIVSIDHPRFVELIIQCMDLEADNRPSASKLITELREM